MNRPPASTWTLLAILYAGGAQGAEVRAILSAGDYLNHAILTYEELEAALRWLLEHGCLEVCGERYCPTHPVLAAFDAIEKKHRAAHRQWSALEQFLETCQERTLPAPDAGLTPARYQQALQAYLDSNP